MKIKLFCLITAALFSGLLATSRNCSSTCNELGNHIPKKTTPIAWTSETKGSPDLGQSPMAHFFQMEI